MKMIITLCALFSLFSALAQAGQSVITEVTGSACMGDDKSRKETEQQAVKEATRRAAEYASTYVKSETHVKDSALESDLISAYANAHVKVIQEMEKAWYKDDSSGECFRTRLKVEVVPDRKSMSKTSEAALVDDPAAPLSVKVWTDRKEYRQGDRIRVYLKANKPFYGRVIYKDANGKAIQLLPNPYRTENYFNGGVVYELPGGNDRFDMEVTPPLGHEQIIVYAATSPLGDLDTTPTGGVYEIRTKPQDVATGTRGIKVVTTGTGPALKPPTAEFAETISELTTRK
jgi:hypothetical protein